MRSRPIVKPEIGLLSRPTLGFPGLRWFSDSWDTGPVDPLESGPGRRDSRHLGRRLGNRGRGSDPSGLVEYSLEHQSTFLLETLNPYCSHPSFTSDRSPPPSGTGSQGAGRFRVGESRYHRESPDGWDREGFSIPGGVERSGL